MNATLTIASREVAEKKFVFVAAFAFSCLALLFPFIPGMHGANGESIFLGSALTANFALALAILLGATIVGRDLSEGRLSFYFSRPVSGSAIWFGKLIASAVLVGLSFAIIIAPAVVVDLMHLKHGWSGNGIGFVTVMAGAATLFFFSAHIAGTMVRSRSPWIALDFVALVLSVYLTWVIVRPLLATMPPRTLEIMLLIAAIWMLMTFIAAGAWQLTHGRTDRVRNHRELSRFLWSAIGVPLFVAGAFTLWVFSASPRDINADVEGQGSGSWVLVSGQVRARGGHHTSFLVNANDGRFVRVGAPAWFGSAISRDGKAAAWLSPVDTRRNTYELMTCDLGAAHPKAESTDVVSSWWDIALSPDGARVLMRNSDTYSVYDIKARRSIVSFNVPKNGNGWTHAYFETRDHVRAYFQPSRAGGEKRPLDVFDFDVPSHTLRHTGTVDDLIRQANHDRSRIVTNRTVYDAATLAPIFHVDDATNLRFLGDDSLAAVINRNGNVSVRHLSADGTPLGEVSLGRYASVWLTGTSGMRALIDLQNGGVQNVASVDVARGVVERVDGEIHRVIRGTDSKEVIGVTSHGVVAWNPATGAKRVIAGS